MGGKVRKEKGNGSEGKENGVEWSGGEGRGGEGRQEMGVEL